MTPESFPIDEVRAQFPYLAQRTYLNTASAGLAWRGQARAVADFYESDLARGIDGQQRWRARAAAVRTRLGALLGVRADAIEFVRNTTEALNLLALSLPLGRRDRVAFAADEFPSVALPWQALANRGVAIDAVPVAHESGRTAVLAAAVGPRTRVLCVSHVHWRTGTRVDLAVLAEACQRVGCRLIVDGAHAAGAVPVDATLADAYCGPAFKWLLSGFGIGFAAVSPRLAAELQPLVRGYGNEPPSRSLEYAHINYPGLYALEATLEYLAALGWPAIHARVDALWSQLAAGLLAQGRVVVTPASAHAGIASFADTAVEDLVRMLAGAGIQVEARGSLLRVAPHFYNTAADVGAFLAALADLRPAPAPGRPSGVPA